MLPTAEFDAAFGPPLESDNTDNEDVGHEDTAGSDEGEDAHHGSGSKSHSKSGGTSGRRSAGGSSHGHGNGGVHPNDLRKKLLKTAQEKAVKARSGSASASRAVSPAGSDDDHSKPTEAQAASTSPTPKRKKGSRAKEAPEAQRAESQEWAKLMPVEFDTGKETETDGMEVDGDDALEMLAKHGLVDQKPFYTNTTFYALLRLLQLLYSRLLHCKETAQKLLAQDRKKSLFTVNPVAEELGLVDAHGPGAVLALAANVPAHSHPSIDSQTNGHEALNGLASADASANVAAAATVGKPSRPEAHFYSYLLDACEKLFEGELDQASFEENMRFLFGTKAYIVFTLDKLIAALIKQVQAVTDNKCQELLTLLAKARVKGTTNVRELIAYRREAEQYLGQDDHLYRIDWDRGQGANVMRIWLLGASDASIDLCGARTASGSDATSKTRARSLQMASRWRTYAESYVLSHPTELVDAARVRKPFLHRTKLEEEGDDANGDGDVPKGRRRWVSEGLVEVGVRPIGLRIVHKGVWTEWRR